MSDKVKSLRFNQDQELFCCCMDTGLRIYNVNPLQELRRYDNNIVGGVDKCEMADRSNYLFIVAGSPRPKFANNQVARFVDTHLEYDYELLFESAVKSIRCSTDKLFVTLENRIFMFNIFSMETITSIETAKNPLGLLEVTPFPESSLRDIAVFPGRKVGSIQLLDLEYRPPGTSSSPVIIEAHQGELACIAINKLGTLVATASSKGTLIRIWDTNRRTLMLELRRGSDSANLCCINFSSDSGFLCCSSDKGTIHIFALKDTSLNLKSKFSNMGILGNYGESQWSLATFTVPPECSCICAFESGTNNSVLAACLDGTFHKYVFTTEGHCNRQCFDVFVDLCDDEQF